MKITIDGEVFDYDATRLMNTEAIALQKVTGMSVQKWTTAMQEGDAYAITGLVWLLWRRNGKEVPFDEVEFDLGAIDIQDDETPADDEPPTDDETPTEAAPATGDSAA